MAKDRPLCGCRMAGSTRDGWLARRRRNRRASSLRFCASVASRTADRSRPGATAFFARSLGGAEYVRLGKSTVATGLATTRLTIKPMASTVLISAAAHPNAESRAARRPEASKNTGFLLVIRRCHAEGQVPARANIRQTAAWIGVPLHIFRHTPVAKIRRPRRFPCIGRKTSCYRCRPSRNRSVREYCGSLRLFEMPGILLFLSRHPPQQP